MSAESSSPPLEPKPPRLSHVEMTELVLPSHTNQLGNIFGGQLVAWIDIAASIAAARHARTVCVTASIDGLHFIEPVRLGQHVVIRASVNWTGRTSMEVGARLESEDPHTGKRSLVATAYLTFVAIDSAGKPQPVPSLLPETEDEVRRMHEAQLRRKSRLELKAGLGRKSLSG